MQFPTLLATALAALAGVASAAPQPHYRVLYRHASLTPAQHPDRHEVVRRHLLEVKGQEEARRRRRRALLGGGRDTSSSLLPSCSAGTLGAHVGVDYVQLGDAESAGWVAGVLRGHPDIAWAELDAPVTAATSTVPSAAPPDDPYIPSQPALTDLGLWTSSPLPRGALAAPAWARTAGSPSVSVCVMDSGLDYSHPDLAPNLWTNGGEIPGNGVDDDGNGYVDDVHGTNVLEISGDVMDDYFHGTHLAGIVGAACYNGVGGCGVAPVVRLMGCKFLDSRGNGYASDAVRCLNYAIAMKADITLNSYGGLYADSEALRTAIAAAEAAGQLFVAAAGNDKGRDLDAAPTFPASYSNGNILTVISTDVDEGGAGRRAGVSGDGSVVAASAIPADAPDGASPPPPPPTQPPGVANFSNFGARTAHIAAPGIAILSTVPGGGYARKTGTSQAAAHVAGAAALLLAALRQVGEGNQRGVEVRDALLAGARRSPRLAGACTSGGSLDVGASMALIPTTGPARAGASDWLTGVASETGRTAVVEARAVAAAPVPVPAAAPAAAPVAAPAAPVADAELAAPRAAAAAAAADVGAAVAGVARPVGGGMSAAEAAAARGGGGLSSLVSAGLVPVGAVEAAAAAMGLPKDALGK